MKVKSIGDGLYEDELCPGRFFIRPFIDGRRTWRKLAANKERFARQEAAAIRSDHQRSKLGLCRDPYSAKVFGNNGVAKLIEAYIAAGCPNKKLERRKEDYIADQTRKLNWIKKYFGGRDPNTVRLRDCTKYQEWRQARTKKAGIQGGNTAIEMELSAFSNVFTYAVAEGLAELNYIGHGRPRLRDADKIKHCRDRAPESGDELNALAAELFSMPSSEVFAWQMLIEAMTGCRTTEVIKFRMDARNISEPGFIDGQYLFLRRLKKGVNPYAMIHPDLAEVIRAHHHWHAVRFNGESPWWFPGRGWQYPVRRASLVNALIRVTKQLGLPHRTSHGMRSFYVTLRRSTGLQDAQVAAEIGDKTVNLIRDTYGDIPPNWRGNAGLSWRPKVGQPIWARWLPDRAEDENKEIPFSPLHSPVDGLFADTQ